MGDKIGFRQQLSTTSYETYELEIAVNYFVHTWTENGSFMQNLTSSLVPFGLYSWLEHEVLHCYTMNARFTADLLPDNCTRFVDSLEQTVDTSNFPTVVGKLTQHFRAPYCFDRILNQNRILWNCEIFVILFNFFYRYLGLDSFPRYCRCMK